MKREGGAGRAGKVRITESALNSVLKFLCGSLSLIRGELRGGIGSMLVSAVADDGKNAEPRERSSPEPP